jgi:cell wall-associated NlpC family hydrolase
MGVEAFRVGRVALALEARYQRLSRRATEGVSLGVRLGTSLARRRPPAALESPDVAAPAPPAPTPTGSDERDPAAEALAARVVSAALAVAGTPYRWGGSEANGFDCSGLIQFAYAEVGIPLPRRSVEQAGSGHAVALERSQLRPGDILAFRARPGGEVSHVGLYLGDGRFVHSATGGVRTSFLAESDPDGRWWLERWVGARRLID